MTSDEAVFIAVVAVAVHKVEEAALANKGVTLTPDETAALSIGLGELAGVKP